MPYQKIWVLLLLICIIFGFEFISNLDQFKNKKYEQLNKRNTFDGDILNIIGLMDESLVYMFRKFDPVYRMMTSRDSGMLNDLFTITKSEKIDLCYMWEIGECEGDTEEMSEEEIAYEDSHPESIKRHRVLRIDEFV